MTVNSTTQFQAFLPAPVVTSILQRKDPLKVDYHQGNQLMHAKIASISGKEILMTEKFQCPDLIIISIIASCLTQNFS